MAEGPRSIRSLFLEGEVKRRRLDELPDQNSQAFQEELRATVDVYRECLKLADNTSLFSPNETLEDISSSDIQYLLLHFYIAELVLRLSGDDRASYLKAARSHYEAFLKLLDSYDILLKADGKIYEQYKDAPESFSTASTTDAAARRATKIARFREEKELKQKLEELQRHQTSTDSDEAVVRDVQLTNINLRVHQTFQALESIAQELQILAMAPPQPQVPSSAPDAGRERQRGTRNEYSERLDQPGLTSRMNRSGPILSSDGKPMRPFTLLDNRQRLQQGVFRPDHNLPTMTIDEYLEEEKRRGGIIEGGGEASMIQPEPDEDNLEKADEETLKARAWDEFKEANPKGSGNTLNRG